MSTARIEHVNITVSDPDATAARLCDIFGWKLRWRGLGKSGGTTVHVGSDSHYLAVWSLDGSSGVPIGRLNHVGVLVDDLAAAEQRVIDAGFVPYNHGDYEPGRRFYFDDADGIEFEVVSYQ